MLNLCFIMSLQSIMQRKNNLEIKNKIKNEIKIFFYLLSFNLLTVTFFLRSTLDYK